MHGPTNRRFQEAQTDCTLCAKRYSAFFGLSGDLRQCSVAVGDAGWLVGSGPHLAFLRKSVSISRSTGSPPRCCCYRYRHTADSKVGFIPLLLGGSQRRSSHGVGRIWTGLRRVNELLFLVPLSTHSQHVEHAFIPKKHVQSLALVHGKRVPVGGYSDLALPTAH